MYSISTEMANAAIEHLKNKKARDIRLLDIHQISTLSDYFIITTGTSTTQVQAMADELEEKMQLQGYKLYHKEGFRGGRWILLDFSNVVVHIFHNDEREFYNLERIWVDAKEIPVENQD